MRRFWIANGAVVLASIVAELAFHHLGHPVYWWHRLPGFDFVYGLAGCIAIVLVSKWLGKLFIQRPEKYHEDKPR